MSIGPIHRARQVGVVAIPAMDEADRIEACLAALACQRDRAGAPVQCETVEIIVFANNCRDGTADVARRLAGSMPFTVSVVEEMLPPEKSNAGWARKRAMDLAAERLIAIGRHDGVILTTDADSAVAPTWLDATFRAFAEGADGVAGLVDASPVEKLRLGADFLGRGRLEDAYLRAIAEIQAVCDPRAHDPWPNHRTSSGASLAVTLAAYLAIGGLPPHPVGEDAALTFALEQAEFRVRHATDVCVFTSVRLFGRAVGGAADTIRHRVENTQAPCGGEIEPALDAVRRAMLKGLFRTLVRDGLLRSDGAWPRRLGLCPAVAHAIVTASASAGFEDMWRRLTDASPKLARRVTLRPHDLPRQIARAEAILRVARRSATRGTFHGAREAALQPEAA